MVNITFYMCTPPLPYLLSFISIDSGVQEGLQGMKVGTSAVYTAYLQNLIRLTGKVVMVYGAAFFFFFSSPLWNLGFICTENSPGINWSGS